MSTEAVAAKNRSKSVAQAVRMMQLAESASSPLGTAVSGLPRDALWKALEGCVSDTMQKEATVCMTVQSREQMGRFKKRCIQLGRVLSQSEQRRITLVITVDCPGSSALRRALKKALPHATVCVGAKELRGTESHIILMDELADFLPHRAEDDDD